MWCDFIFCLRKQWGKSVSLTWNSIDFPQKYNKKLEKVWKINEVVGCLGVSLYQGFLWELFFRFIGSTSGHPSDLILYYPSGSNQSREYHWHGIQLIENSKTIKRVLNKHAYTLHALTKELLKTCAKASANKIKTLVSLIWTTQHFTYFGWTFAVEFFSGVYNVFFFNVQEQFSTLR